MVAATPSARPKTSAAASTKRCQRWLKSGTRRRLLRCSAGGVVLTRLGFLTPLQPDHRALAVRFFPGVPGAGIDVRVLLVEALVVLPVDHPGPGLELLASGLHGHHRVGLEVVVPGGVRGRPAFGGNDHVVPVVPVVDQGRRAYLSGLGALGGQDQDVSPEKRTTGRLAVGAHILDEVAVEVMKAAHEIAYPAAAPLIPR